MCPIALWASQWALFRNRCAVSLEAQRPGVALVAWTQFPLGGFIWAAVLLELGP